MDEASADGHSLYASLENYRVESVAAIKAVATDPDARYLKESCPEGWDQKKT